MNTVALAISLLFYAPLATSPTAPARSDRRIHVEQTHVDMGSVYRGEIASHTYKVENRGAEALEIHQIKLHCSCTSIAMLAGNPPERIELDSHGFLPKGRKIQIEPGQSVDLIVLVDTTAMPERTLTKSVDIFSDDPVQPDLPLTFDFTIVHPAIVKPRRLNFGELRPGEEKSLSVTLSLLPELNLNFTGTSRQKRLKTAVKKISAEGEPGVWELTVTVDKDLAPGSFATVINVNTDHPRIQSVAVPVFGKIRSNILFDLGSQIRRVLDFGEVPADAGATRVIQIRNTRPDVPYRIERMEILGVLKERAKARVRTIEEGVSYEIEISLPAGLEEGKFVGDLVVHADHPTDQERKVRFRGQIK